MSYGFKPSPGPIGCSGGYASRILKGEKPGDLPTKRATKFGLVMDIETAKALGPTYRQCSWHAPTR